MYSEKELLKEINDSILTLITETRLLRKSVAEIKANTAGLLK